MLICEMGMVLATRTYFSKSREEKERGRERKKRERRGEKRQRTGQGDSRRQEGREKKKAFLFLPVPSPGIS